MELQTDVNAAPVHGIVTQPRTVNPYYDAEGITIYHGDTFDLFHVVDSVDVVITDPPYGVLDEDWDAMSDSEFRRMSMEWLSVCKRKASTLVSFCSEKYRKEFTDILHHLWQTHRQLIWNKCFGTVGEGGYWYSYESIYHCHSGTLSGKGLVISKLLKQAREKAGLSKGGVEMAVLGKKTRLCYRWEEAACIPSVEHARKLAEVLNLGDEWFNALREAREGNCGQAEKMDVLTYRPVTNGRHPCEKPLGLMCDLITTLTKENDLILDPFMGSGTTLEAAKLSGRRAIGFEMNERYCETAARRLAQGVLF